MRAVGPRSIEHFDHRKFHHHTEWGRPQRHRLGRVSKAGPADIRRLLIIGAMARLSWAGRKPPVQGSWLSRMLARMLVAIALANKMARTIWAMLTKQEDYRR
jgi:transposase